MSAFVPPRPDSFQDEVPVKFFRVLSDVKWRVANDCGALAEYSTDRQCVMPPIACPVCGSAVRDTRNPGFCYPAAEVSRFPCTLRKKLDYGTVAPPDEWEELRRRVIASLPYEVPLRPGTLFGPGTIEVKGRFADCYPNLQLGDGRFMISRTALERLRASGISDLFAAPAKIMSKRKTPDEYFELQIEHAALLNGSLDRKAIEADLREIDADWARNRVLVCDRCGREDGQLPKRIILVGSSIPDQVSLFRLAQRPRNVFCTEQFFEAVTRLNLTNILFESVKTDGSEKKDGFAKARQSRPDLWPGSLSGAKATVPPREPEKPRKLRKPKPLPPAQPVKSLLGGAALQTRARALEALACQCVRFGLSPADNLPVGSSRFGGLPDLPRGSGWPSRRSAQLDFLLQVNLADLTRVLPESPLPKAGWLWFFYDAENCPWGRDRDDRKGWQVSFWDGPGVQLTRAPAPDWLAAEAALPVCSLSLQTAEWLPDHTAPCVRMLKLSERELTAYRQTLKKLRAPEDNPLHKLLGWPDTIQNDMAELCSKVAGGKDWRVLLQLDSEEGAGMMWGDAGRLYFWIREQDLIARRFDRCWVMLQCF